MVTSAIFRSSYYGLCVEYCHDAALFSRHALNLCLLQKKITITKMQSKVTGGIRSANELYAKVRKH